MNQQGFGRRQSSRRGTAESNAADRDTLAAVERRSAGKSIGILVAVGGLVVIAAVSGAVALGASTSPAPATPSQATVSTPKPCVGQTDCANQYNVALNCGSSEARTVSVIALDAEAAERKAERYNRECRSRSVSFVAVFARGTATGTATSAVRTAVTRQPESPHNASTGGTRTRTRVRVRRR